MQARVDDVIMQLEDLRRAANADEAAAAGMRAQAQQLRDSAAKCRCGPFTGAEMLGSSKVCYGSVLIWMLC